MGRVVRLALEHRDISLAALAVAANALRDLRDHREWAAAMLMPLCDQLGIRDVLWYPARNTASSRDLGSESRSRAWRCTFALRDGGTPRTKAMATTSFQHAPTSALASEARAAHQRPQTARPMPEPVRLRGNIRFSRRAASLALLRKRLLPCDSTLSPRRPYRRDALKRPLARRRQHQRGFVGERAAHHRPDRRSRSPPYR